MRAAKISQKSLWKSNATVWPPQAIRARVFFYKLLDFVQREPENKSRQMAGRLILFAAGCAAC
jgi:hypothetical protein